jgi:hypothetical protein
MVNRGEADQVTMLVIDDDRRYADALFRDGQKVGIALLHASSLEEGKEMLESAAGRSLAGIILDVECYKRKIDETPDSSFIIAATKYFTEKAGDIPLVAITGVQPLYDRYSKDFSGIWKVYRKGRDEAEMLCYLREKALELERVKIVNRYRDVVEIAEEYLGGEAAGELVDCLAGMGETSPAKIRGTLANLRTLQERIYIELHRFRPEMVPGQFVVYRDKGAGKSSVNVAQILEHLKGNYDPKAQKHTGTVYIHHRSSTYRFSEMVYKVASDGVHAIDGDDSVKPSRYTVQAVTFALLDLLLWFRAVVEPDGTRGK